MRLVHLADVHLGYRAYNRITSQGLNWREADVFNAFRSALNKIVEVDPDLVIVAGDLFHVVRPSNLCIQHAFRAFVDLKSKIMAPVVIIGGNHDSPRSTDTGCILDLLQNVPGIYVAHTDYKGITIKEIDTTVYCLCHRALGELSSLKIEPESSTKYNVLAVHGTLEGVSRNFYDTTMITRSQVMNDAWDYIAFGHYHLFEKLADNAYYSGSIEYTSFNIWSETEKPKGVIEYDLDKHELVKFHELKVRDVIDLKPVDATGLSAEEVDVNIKRRFEKLQGGHQDKIVRLVVENIPRSVQSDLDFSSIRKIKTEALHFEFQPRQPKIVGFARDGGEPTASRPLEEEWRDYAMASDPPGGVEKKRLYEMGLEYLKRFDRGEG